MSESTAARLAEKLRDRAAATMDGGMALPGFTLPLQQLFAELDRHG